jgi:hypothetical protein
MLRTRFGNSVLLSIPSAPNSVAWLQACDSDLLVDICVVNIFLPLLLMLLSLCRTRPPLGVELPLAVAEVAALAGTPLPLELAPDPAKPSDAEAEGSGIEGRDW